MIICDLDGTLADCQHRRYLVEGKKKNFEQFYDACHADTVIRPVLAVVIQFTDCDYPVELVIVTGRPERTRAMTEAWLKQHCDLRPEEYRMYMRPDKDNRADDIIKQEILDKFLDKDKILFVLDDRQRVVDMWRRNGVTCFQVAPGQF